MNLNNTSVIGRLIDRIDHLLWQATEEELILILRFARALVRGGQGRKSC